MTRRLHLPAACAALLAALPCAAYNPTDALGRFVLAPSALASTPPADIFGDSLIAVCPATYRTVCGLGDMALERLYVPSEGGWASAPPGYALTAMAEDGWETPTAARHARLYDLAYSCLTNPAPRLDLPNGMKVYPLMYDYELDTSGLLCNWSTDVPAPDVNALGLGAACGGFGFAGEDYCTPVVADLRSMLTSYGFGGPSADPSAARAAVVASALEDYRAAASISGASFASVNYLARGGIRPGDPLRAVDPFAANWWMKRTSTVPALIPASALPPTTNEVTVTAYELRATSAAVAAAARALVLAGGGEATVPSTLSTRAVGSARREAGPPTLALDVSYTRSYAVPSVRATVRRTDSKTGDGGWESVGTTRVTSPAAGTLTVSRKRIAGTTTYAVVGAEASGVAVFDAKTNTVTRPIPVQTPDVGWPHASSQGRIVYVSATAFGRRTRRSSRNGSEATETVEYGAYRCGVSENVVGDALRAACSEYYSPSVEYLTQWKDDQLGTAKISVYLPDLTATAWERYVYRSVFAADDPEWEPEGGGGNTQTCYNDEPAYNFGRWPFDPTADPDDNDWDGGGYGDGENDPKPTEDPDTGYPRVTEYEVDCGVMAWREGEPSGNGMGYTTHEECRVERPSALLLVKFDFLHF